MKDINRGIRTKTTIHDIHVQCTETPVKRNAISRISENEKQLGGSESRKAHRIYRNSNIMSSMFCFSSFHPQIFIYASALSLPEIAVNSTAHITNVKIYTQLIRCAVNFVAKSDWMGHGSFNQDDQDHAMTMYTYRQ